MFSNELAYRHGAAEIADTIVFGTDSTE